MQSQGISVPRVRERDASSITYGDTYSRRVVIQPYYPEEGVPNTYPGEHGVHEMVRQADWGPIMEDHLVSSLGTSSQTLINYQRMADYTFHREGWRSPEERKREWTKAKAFAKLHKLQVRKLPNLEWWYDYIFRTKKHHWPYQGCNSLRKYYPKHGPRVYLHHDPTWSEIAWSGTPTYWTWHQFNWDLWLGGTNLLPWVPLSRDFESRFMSKAQFDGWSRNGWSLEKCRILASSAMIPDMEDGLSIPVFLAEWKDVPRMFRELASGLRHLVDTFKRFLSHPVIWWSQANLSANFGWLPFIRDIKELFSRLMTLREDVSHFIDDSSKLLTYHFRRSIDPLDIKTTDYFIPTCGYAEKSAIPEENYQTAGIYSIGVNYKVVKEVEVEYHATAFFHYTVPFQGTFAKIFAALDRFGFNVSLSDVWEVVPFSFVVDWFFDIQSLIETLDFTNVPVQIVIHDFCDSISFKYAEHFELDESFTPPVQIVPCGDYPSLVPTSDWTIPPFSPSELYSEEGYYRWTGNWTVDLTEYPQMRTPKGTQIVLLANLVATH